MFYFFVFLNAKHFAFNSCVKSLPESKYFMRSEEIIFRPNDNRLFNRRLNNTLFKAKNI